MHDEIDPLRDVLMMGAATVRPEPESSSVFTASFLGNPEFLLVKNVVT